MKAFIDDHREAYGVESICKVLPIAPSTYHEHAARKADPDGCLFACAGMRRSAFRFSVSGAKISRSTARTDFVLDALEQALHARQPVQGGLIHHSDRGVQYVSIRYTERLAEAGIEPSVGSVGDSYDNALAETINRLYKAEVIHRQSWKSREAVELATRTWVDWYNNRRLLSSIGNIPPAEAEAAYYRQLDESALAA